MRCSCCSKDIFQNLTFSEIIGVSKYRLPQTCSVCRAQFHLLETRGCSGCQKPIHFNLESTKKKVKSIPVYCSDCQEWKKKYPTYDFQHRAFFVYDENMKAWLNQYKFMGDIRLAGTFAYKWTQIKKEYTTYIYCPIPLSEKRRTERGFNQVSEMLKAARIPFQMLLKREKHLLAQAKNTRKERLEMPQPFELAVTFSKIQNKKILIIDDVYTTGQTLFHAADCLQVAQPKIIRTISLAR